MLGAARNSDALRRAGTDVTVGTSASCPGGGGSRGGSGLRAGVGARAVNFFASRPPFPLDHGHRLVGPGSGRAGSGCQVGQWLELPRGERSRGLNGP